MHRVLIFAATLLGVFTMSTATVAETLAPDDAAAIQSVLDRQTAAWNAHDIDAFVAETTPDVDWVNVVGMHWQGRDAVRRAHVIFHKGFFAHSRLLPAETSVMRQIAPGVALVVYTGRIEGVGPTPDGAPYPTDGSIMTVVMVKTPEGWRIAHAHNTYINAMAVAHDPSKAPS
jgi:uncharacterized protein (TIGR02246 family)